MKPLTDCLFARATFLGGVARILDFGNTLQEYNYSISPGQADYLAMRSDWLVTGQDLWDALHVFEEQLQESQKAPAGHRP